METAQGAPSTTARVQIDTIVYLASLAAQSNEVDQLLDRLRQLTAERGSIDLFTPADQVVLADIQHRLETYLVEKESLRGFTKESLQQKVAQHNGQRSPLSRPALVMTAIVVISLILTSISYLLRHSPVVSERLSSSIPIFYMCIFAGASLLCFTALKDFKQELRRPYLFFAIGVGVMGLSFVYTVIISLLGHEEAYLEHLELTIFPFLLSQAAIYIGMRSFAQALGIRSWALTRRVVVSASIIAVAVVVAMPHVENGVGEVFFDLSVAILALTGVLSAAGSTVMYRIVKNVNKLYSRPIGWLLTSCLTLAISLVAFMIIRFTVAGAMPPLIGMLLSLPTTFGSLFMLKAAAEFNNVSRY